MGRKTGTMCYIEAGNESPTCYSRYLYDSFTFARRCRNRGNPWENNAVFGPFQAEIKVVDVGDLKLGSQ